MNESISLYREKQTVSSLKEALQNEQIARKEKVIISIE
jgi:hypothetical protein